MLVAEELRRIGVGPIDLKVEPGTCVAITGPSGAGKSVLLRMIADLDPHEGDVYLDGDPCSTMPPSTWRRRVTYVSAESGWWSATVGDHFQSTAGNADLFVSIGIAADAASWPVARLSTGERQRLALLRALHAGLRILLLDEPTSGLDEASVVRVEALLKDRMLEGVGIVLVTHDVAQASRMAAHRFRLDDGRLQQIA